MKNVCVYTITVNKDRITVLTTGVSAMTNYEFRLFDGEYFHTLNLVNVDEDNKTATVAITYTGRISVKDFDLQQDNTGLYFEYG